MEENCSMTIVFLHNLMGLVAWNKMYCFCCCIFICLQLGDVHLSPQTIVDLYCRVTYLLIFTDQRQPIFADIGEHSPYSLRLYTFLLWRVSSQPLSNTKFRSFAFLSQPILLFVFLISLILHHHPALLHRHTLILDLSRGIFHSRLKTSLS